MDTDFLTREAYRVLISSSSDISEYLTPLIGSASRDYSDENLYLEAMYEYVTSIASEPEDFLDDWNLLDDTDPIVFGSKLKRLAESIRDVIRTPIESRGPVDD